jgi:hypothetical protein
MVKNILLKFENEKEYFALSNLKSRYEMLTGQSLTWEQFIWRLKLNFERMGGLK